MVMTDSMLSEVIVLSLFTATHYFLLVWLVVIGYWRDDIMVLGTGIGDILA